MYFIEEKLCSGTRVELNKEKPIMNATDCSMLELLDQQKQEKVFRVSRSFIIPENTALMWWIRPVNKQTNTLLIFPDLAVPILL